MQQGIHTNVVFIFRVSFVHHFEEFDFNLRLVEERFLVLDYLDGHVALFFVIVSFDYLAERSFANERVDFVPVKEAFTMPYNVVVVVIIVAVVVQLAFLLVLGVLTLRLLGPALLLGIVNLVDVLVRLDQVDRQFTQWGQGGVAELTGYPRLHGLQVR